MVAFTPWELGNATYQGFYFPESKLLTSTAMPQSLCAAQHHLLKHRGRFGATRVGLPLSLLGIATMLGTEY